MTQDAAVTASGEPCDQAGWWCPDCDRFLVKPPYLREGNRLHSWRCDTAMVRSVRRILLSEAQ